MTTALQTLKSQTMSTPKPNRGTNLELELFEWERKVVTVSAEQARLLLGEDLAIARTLQSLSGKVEVRRTVRGIEVETTSFVGNLVVGPITMRIRPKIGMLPLSQLLRYAYRLRDIETINEVAAGSAELGFLDLLIALLAGEVEELLHRGLSRAYIPFRAVVDRPRGRIDTREIVRRGGIREAKLPCEYHERHVDSLINRVVLGALREAAGATLDKELRHRVLRLAQSFDDVQLPRALSAADIDRAETQLTRLTAAYRPALALARLIHGMVGSDLTGQRAPSVAGFLFDMNLFYERLLSRFLRDNLIDQTVQDQYVLGDVFAFGEGERRRKAVPRPRPDFAIFKGKVLCGFFDAKYRDLWNRDLPPGWLYQLSIYALASPTARSVMLYATMSPEASDILINVQSPMADRKGTLASVVLRPVDLGRLAELVNPRVANRLAEARREYARALAA